MKSFWLIIFLFSFLFACQKDELDPDETNSKNKISELIIGPQGGSMNSDSIMIFVPPGSFDSEYNLELWVAEDITDGGNRVSKSYILKGIPYNFKIPVKIGIQCEKDLVKRCFLSVGYPQVNRAGSNEELIFDLLPANDSVNYLCGEFQPVFINKWQ